MSRPLAVMLSWINKYIGIKIREARKEKNLTQEELGYALNLSRTSIANFEAGTQSVSIADLYKIAIKTEKDIFEFLPETHSVKNFLTKEVREKVIEDPELSPAKKNEITSFLEKVLEEKTNG